MIEIKNLCFGYNKSLLFIKDFNLKINKGDKVVLLGGEGMGKTSLLKLLCGLERQYVGLITINNKDISDLNLRDLRVSYLPTDPVYLKSTLRKNLEFLCKVEGFKFLEAEILEVFKLFNFNYGLDVKMSKLSLVDKRIFALIRAYLKNANIVFIDNQFSLLNDEMCNKIKSAINVFVNENNNKKTLILTDFYDCDCEINKFVYLSYGKYFIFENMEDLFNNPPDYFVCKYCNSYEKDVLILLKNGEFFVCEYDFVFDKKCKKDDVNIKNMVKIDKKFKYFAKNECLSDGDYIRAKLTSREEINELTDNEFNLKLNKSLFIFNASTMEKMF